MGTIKELRGLKCPNHENIRDNYCFTYECIGGLRPHNGTRGVRCGYTMSLHKPQNDIFR